MEVISPTNRVPILKSVGTAGAHDGPQTDEDFGARAALSTPWEAAPLGADRQRSWSAATTYVALQ